PLSYSGDYFYCRIWRPRTSNQIWKNFCYFLPNLVNILARKMWPDGRKIVFNRGLPPFAEQHNDWYRDTLARLFALLQEGQIEPVIGAKLPLTEAAHAHELLETGAVSGKIVLYTAACE
ncbi:MAG TPA: hypothetical protein EYP41_10650, partial [Anaerolineae bacterium]|nr:hypothetical protein [Anaerolineae bacterium]